MDLSLPNGNRSGNRSGNRNGNRSGKKQKRAFFEAGSGDAGRGLSNTSKWISDPSVKSPSGI
jgi:hypothetical protein